MSNTRETAYLYISSVELLALCFCIVTCTWIWEYQTCFMRISRIHIFRSENEQYGDGGIRDTMLTMMGMRMKCLPYENNIYPSTKMRIEITDWNGPFVHTTIIRTSNLSNVTFLTTERNAAAEYDTYIRNHLKDARLCSKLTCRCDTYNF